MKESRNLIYLNDLKRQEVFIKRLASVIGLDLVHHDDGRGAYTILVDKVSNAPLIAVFGKRISGIVYMKLDLLKYLMSIDSGVAYYPRRNTDVLVRDVKFVRVDIDARRVNSMISGIQKYLRTFRKEVIAAEAAVDSLYEMLQDGPLPEGIGSESLFVDKQVDKRGGSISIEVRSKRSGFLSVSIKRHQPEVLYISASFPEESRNVATPLGESGPYWPAPLDGVNSLAQFRRIRKLLEGDDPDIKDIHLDVNEYDLIGKMSVVYKRPITVHNVKVLLGAIRMILDLL